MTMAVDVATRVRAGRAAPALPARFRPVCQRARPRGPMRCAASEEDGDGRAAPSPSPGGLQAVDVQQLHWRRKVRAAGMRTAGVMGCVGALGVASLGDVHSDALSQVLVAAVGVYTLGTFVLPKIDAYELQVADLIMLEVYKGRLYAQMGTCPSSNPFVPAEDIEVKETGDGRGRGAYAKVPLRKGCWMYYDGELLDNDAFYSRYPTGVADYCMGLDKDHVIDAAEISKSDIFTGGHINHSRSEYNLARWFQRGKRRIMFYALRDIQPGEELLIDYGRLYWTGREEQEI